MEKHSVWKSLLTLAAFIAEIAVSAKEITTIVVAVAGSGLIGITIGLIYKNQTILWVSASCLVFLATVLTSVVLVSYWHTRKDIEISEAFCNLQDVYETFEAEAIKIAFLLAIDLGQRPVRVGELRTLHREYLKQLCETAVTVLNAKNLFKRPIRANIKAILSNDKPALGPLDEFAFTVLARSGNTSRERRASDRTRLLNHNYTYSAIFNPKKDNDFYCCGNLKPLINKLRLDPDTAKFTFLWEPQPTLVGLYKSFLTLPIMGVRRKRPPDKNGVSEKPPSDKSICFKYSHNDKDYDVYGLMCVDSTK